MASEIGMRIPSKIFLTGFAQAGKTSIKEVVFGGFDPKTLKIKPTIQSKVPELEAKSICGYESSEGIQFEPTRAIRN